MSLVEVNGFNTLIDNKPFFDQPVKSKQETHEKLIEMSMYNPIEYSSNYSETTGSLCFFIR